MIPKTKTQPSFDLAGYHWLIYGQPKIGKSSFAANFSDILFLPTEPGLESLSVFKMPTERSHISCWAEFKSIVKEILEAHKEKVFPFKIIAIDTIDNLYEMCMEHVCTEKKVKHPSEGAYGAVWSAISGEFKREILKLSNVTKLMFISHNQEVETEVQRIKIQRTQPTISGGEKGRFITGMVDFIAYIANDPKDPAQRVAFFRGNEGLVAGDRTCKMDAMTPFDYKEIEKKFKGGK
jgi:hypothetical protein